MVSKIKRTKGFTLIEVLFSAVLAGAATTAIVSYFVFAQQSRIQVEGRRQAALAADYRCQLFSAGLTYPDVFTSQDTRPQTEAAPIDYLPGGFPVREIRESVTIASDGNTAQIEVTCIVETSLERGATATAVGIRVR